AAYSVVVQADGKIVVAGYSVSSGNRQDFALARYNPDGSLDSNFGDNHGGKATTDFAGFADAAASVAVQADGKIVAAGSGSRMLPSGTVDFFALARYDCAGALDATFGAGGK